MAEALRIVVLLKPVPDTTGEERFGPDRRVDRDGLPAVINPNDEHALEAALRLLEARPEGGEATLLSMAPPSANDVLRKGLAMGAHRAVLVTDPALQGACALSTARVLAAALREIDFDLVLAGADTSDGRGGVVPAAISVLLGLPLLSQAGAIEVTGRVVRVIRRATDGQSVLESALPAVVTATQTVGEPRYPTLRGILAARSKSIAVRGLGDLSISSDAGALAALRATTRVLEIREVAGRREGSVVREPPAEAARQLVEYLAARHLL